MSKKNQRFYLMLALIPALLFIPLIAMQISEEVSWSLWDFIIAGSLLVLLAIILELILRKVRSANNRILLILFILILFILLWTELAVGLL
jgi:hypothetical protein